MIIVLKPEATPQEVEHIVRKLESLGLRAHISRGVERTIIGAIGDETILRALPLETIPGVEKVLPVLKPYKLVSREFKPENSLVKAGNVVIGGNCITVMAGPCAVENQEMLMMTAEAVKRAGAHILRGGAFKPRTNPYSFQGLGEEGLKLLALAREKTGLPVVTEVRDTRQVDLVSHYADILQIGTRSMANFDLLREVGKSRKPVVLKRGMMSTIKEFLMSAEYIVSEGNENVILCERGIRTFEDATRNTLDLSAVPVVKQESHLPVIVDPCHATGKWRLVIPMARAAIAAGADGLLIEVHPFPEDALSDGDQSLLPSKFDRLMEEVRLIAQAVGRTL